MQTFGAVHVPKGSQEVSQYGMQMCFVDSSPLSRYPSLQVHTSGSVHFPLKQAFSQTGSQMYFEFSSNAKPGEQPQVSGARQSPLTQASLQIGAHAFELAK